MSDDLIRRSEVIKVLEDCYLDKELFEKDVFDGINALPIAFDKEAVVEKLEEEKEKIANEEYCKGKNFYKNDCAGKNCFVCCAEHLIDIVKAGGIDG